ncbi:hypothetical protein [Oceanobacillus halophilus]|uniref:Uncharacterized protein n=1 Tax=Oceanobacillus halophilus TaxID=930130 RepID=A0A495A192_9BACI|nr:hypothetical protein [Oceanobacillus halophilus]RKQ31492.1 hypothetical protein D8M06_13445 [Oceanobacillus halophilus]
MGERIVYLLFTDTGTLLSKTINYFTKQQLNHVSISFDKELKEVYSFGRKYENNPFIGGFVREDTRGELLKKSECEIYTYQLSEEEYQRIYYHVKVVEARKHAYKYNFIGLFCILIQLEWNRSNAFFCSQFIASLLNDIEHINFDKPDCFVRPADIRELNQLKLIYKGRLGRYFSNEKPAANQLVEQQQNVSTFYLPRKLLRFVMK